MLESGFTYVSVGRPTNYQSRKDKASKPDIAI